MSMCIKKKKKVCFSAEEDKEIVRSVQTMGLHRAAKVLSTRFGRTPRSIKERYENAINPVLQTEFTEEEDKLLLKLVHDCGKNWVLISRIMSNKSPGHVKGRYNKLIRKLEKGMISSDGTRKNGYSERTFGLKNRRKKEEKCEEDNGFINIDTNWDLPEQLIMFPSEFDV